jgi:hypothetical protein
MCREQLKAPEVPSGAIDYLTLQLTTISAAFQLHFSTFKPLFPLI